MPATHDALIFDCDGVLVDSESIALEVEMALLADRGIDYGRETYIHRFAGITQQEYRAKVVLEARIEFGVHLAEAFFLALETEIATAYRERLKAIPGAAALAAAWSKPKAIASSSSRETLQFKLQTTELRGLFGEHVYSADLVPAGKPDPAIFVYAANRLGVAATRCAVVEDSVHGIVAAKRAGMTAVGFTGGGHCLPGHRQHLEHAGADVVLEDFWKLAAYLGLHL